jgi:hypothetical protein
VDDIVDEIYNGRKLHIISTLFGGCDVLREVQRQVKERPRRESPQASDWIGNLIIDVLHLDRADPIARAKARKIFAQ